MWETAFEESMLDRCENLLIHCPDGEHVEYLMEIFARNGVTWCGTGEDVISHTNWNEYGSDTCYWVESKKLSYSDKQYAEEDMDHKTQGYVKCTFYGVESSDFEVASDDEFYSLLGIARGE